MKGRRVYSEQRQPSSAWYIAWLRPAVIALAIAMLLFLGYRFFEEYLSIPVTIILLAIILTYLLRPLVERMVRLTATRYAPVARVFAVLILYGLIGWGVYRIGAVTVTTLQNDVTQLQNTWTQKREQIPGQYKRLSDWYNNTLPNWVKQPINDVVGKEIKATVPGVLPKIMGAARKAFEWAGLLIELIFVPLVAFYLLTDASRVREQVMTFIPVRYRESVVHYAGGMDGILRQYVIGQLLLCVIAWVVVTAALLMMGIPGALLLGIVAGLSRAIPVIGPLIGGVPVLAAVLIDNPWPGALWWVLAGYILLHLLESKVLMPRILGDQLGIHPVLIIISLLLGYELLGLLGMFIAPPAVAMIRFTLQERRKEAKSAADEPEPPAELIATTTPDTPA
jgi:predicted PurR-regulated permease PerM